MDLKLLSDTPPDLPGAIICMQSRVSSLLIGVDQYKTGSIWNLESCVDDAQNVQRGLLEDLKVHICMLLDRQATKENIETCFLTHLLQNAKIAHGDAISIYFAGHGSTIRAPIDWFHSGSVAGTAEVLCTCDFGYRRVAGISDRSLHGMLLDLSKAKGDNITVILDSCFSPLQSPANIRDRHRTRWTPSEKVSSEDLTSTAFLHNYRKDVDFCNATESYTLLAACGPGEKAMEGKEGGKFTSTLLQTVREISLHTTSYTSMLRHTRSKIGDGQRPISAGIIDKRSVFEAVPFTPDEHYFQAETVHNSKTLRIWLGSVHGVVEGTEFSDHVHNYFGSCNPLITRVSTTQVYPTGSFGRTNCDVPSPSWVQVRKWNHNRTFGLRSKKSLSLLKRASRGLLQSVARSLLLLP